MQKTNYPLRYLEATFKPVEVDDSFGRKVMCYPYFTEVDFIAPKHATETLNVNGTKFRYKKWGYMPQTKNYQITYQIL